MLRIKQIVTFTAPFEKLNINHMKTKTSLKYLLITLSFMAVVDVYFSSCNQPQGSESGGYTSQSVPTTSASRVATSSTGDAVYFATNAQDFQSGLTLAETSTIRYIYYVGESMTGDFYTINPKAKELKIVGAVGNISISRKLPTNQYQAVDSANNFYQVKYAIENCTFTGSGSNGINLNCCYASIRDCNFNGKDTSINLTFCMNAQVINNQVINSKKGGICLNVGTGKWSGAGNSTSASNHPFIEGNRVFNMQGAEFGLALIGLSGAWVQNHISEGKSPMYHIIINDLNSTTAWNYNLNNIHLESIATGAGFLIKSRQSIVNIVSPYVQYPMTLIDASSYAGVVQVNVENLCWQPSGTKYASTGNCRFRFKDLYNSGRVDSTLYWVGGKFPNVLTQENLTANGLVVKNYVNGKKI